MAPSSSTRQQVWKALWRATLLSLPLFFFVGTYLVCDPFRVLRSYDFGNYYDDAAPVELNRDYVSLEMFLKRNQEQHFDSFILGSSRSFPLHCETWKKFVPGMRPYHYP